MKLKSNSSPLLTTTLFVLILISGCTNETNRKEPLLSNDAIEIKLDSIKHLDKNKSVISEVSYVKLELNDESIIGEVDKIRYLNSRFYIFDKSVTKSVFVFSNSGKYLYKIARLGKGPGEYIFAMDFDVDTLGNIYVYDNARDRLLKYGTTGDFIKEYDTGTYLEEFLLGEDERMIVRNAYKNGPDITANLGIINLKNQHLETFFKGGEIQDNFDIPRFSSHYLFKSDNNIYYYARFTNNIYKISNNKISKSIIFEPHLFPPDELISKIKKDMKVIFENFENNTYLFDIRDIFENSEFVILKYKKMRDFILLISKATEHKTIFSTLKDKNYFGENMIYGVADGKFISIIKPISLNKKWHERVDSSELKLNIKTQLHEINTNSNPTICFIKFKEF